MQALAEAFGRVELGSVLHQLRAAGRAWSGGRLVTCIDPFDRVEAGNPIFYAAVAETVRHALYWCLCRRVADSGLLLRSVQSWGEVEPLVRLAWSVQLNEPFVGRPELSERFDTESFMGSALRLVLPQSLPQRRSPYSIGRALLMLDEAPRRRAMRLPRFDAAALAAQIERALGCDLPTFVTAVAQLTGAAAHRDVLSIATLVSPDLRLDEPLWFGKGVRRPAVGRALDLLAQDAEARPYSRRPFVDFSFTFDDVGRFARWLECEPKRRSPRSTSCAPRVRSDRPRRRKALLRGARTRRLS